MRRSERRSGRQLTRRRRERCPSVESAAGVSRTAIDSSPRIHFDRTRTFVTESQ